MVRILTSDFNELDLTPGYEFQIELSNPMFDSGHLPEAFSTQISFPPSPTNREKFGYIPVLMRPPLVQQLSASVWIGGVPFMYGNLIYDGIEDGNLLYTFTGKIPDLEAKIWDQQLLEFSTDNLPGRNDTLFRAPLVIRNNNVAMQPYLKGAADDNLWVKYWNYSTVGKSYDYQSFLPAIPISAIIAWLGLKTPDDLQFLLETISILGRYHEYISGDVVAGNTSSRIVASRDGSRISSRTRSRTPSYSSTQERTGSRRRTSRTTDLASFLPDITFAELLRGIASMLCCSFYMEEGTFRMVRNASVLESDPVDWRGKVSDRFSAEIQAAASYRFGFGNSDEKASRPSVDSRSTNYVEAGANGTFNPAIILNALARTGLYSIVFDATTGDMFSGRSYDFAYETLVPSGYSAPIVFDCDVIYQNAKPVSLEIEDEDSESFDNSCSFELVRCVPEKVFPHHGSGMWPTEADATYRMTPVVDPGSVSEGRDSKVYVGIIDNLFCQMTDHDQFLPAVEIEKALLGRNGLSPEQLYEAHHQIYAEWMARRRQLVKTTVNLSPSDLHSFRLYTPVYFAGRKWVVKRLSVTAMAASDDIEVSGEFVEI